MNNSLLVSALVLAVGSALHAPSFAAPKNALPAQARAYLPKRSTTFLWKRLPIGPKGTTMLVHVWGATRVEPSGGTNGYSPFVESPFCVDVFAPELNEKKQWQWRLASSVAYLDSTEPRMIETHWLQPAKKQGPVLHIISGNGAPGVSTYHKLFMWPKGFESGWINTAQEFGSGGSGGGSLSQKFDGVDERGFMTVVTDNSYGGGMDRTVSRWDGERFVAGSPAKYHWDGKKYIPEPISESGSPKR